MRAELVKEIPVHRYTVFAEMAWLQRRRELGEICRMARDAGGAITPAVVRQALPGLTETAAHNMIRRCDALGLCDRSGTLRQLGDRAADSDLAPIPEQGVYDIWVVDHPLVRRRALHAERLTPNPRDRTDIADNMALPVEPERHTVYTSAIDPNSKFQFRSFRFNGNEVIAVVRPPQRPCKLRWTLDWTHQDNELILDGRLDTATGRRTIIGTPEHAEIDLWWLMEQWRLGPLSPHGTWDPRARRLGVTHEGLTIDEVDRFTRTLNLAEVEVPGYGRWNSARLSDVPIGPATSADTHPWAIDRLDRLLRTNGTAHTRTGVRNLFAEATEDTPLEPMQPTLPAHDVLLASYQDDLDMFWRLAAPVDLAPHPPTLHELGPFTIGTAPATGLTPDDEVVRVMHPTMVSMKALVDRLTCHQRPDRLLLVDPYVRGDHNLASLRLLVAALTGQDPPVIEVWTGNQIDDDTLAQIKAITGTSPRRYREVFGPGWRPHDRYLVVEPQHGTNFGWHMTNSPLHARIPDDPEPDPHTPLRWRDLAAFRLTVDQLPERIRAWVNGEHR